MLVEAWQGRLEQMHVPSKPDLSLINYLSHPSERLEWAANNLPNDDLCVENAIMMKRFNRYPLIIDPSGQVTRCCSLATAAMPLITRCSPCAQATDFLMTQYKERKIVRTSFLDDAFLKVGTGLVAAMSYPLISFLYLCVAVRRAWSPRCVSVLRCWWRTWRTSTRS